MLLWEFGTPCQTLGNALKVAMGLKMTTKCSKCKGRGWLWWNELGRYFCPVQEDCGNETVYLCDMCCDGQRNIDHLPKTKELYKCENVIGEEAHVVSPDYLVWLNKEKMWICKDCILWVSNDYTNDQVADLDLYSFQNFIDESVQW